MGLGSWEKDINAEKRMSVWLIGVVSMPLSWIEQMVRKWLEKKREEEIRQNQAKIKALTSED